VSFKLGILIGHLPSYVIVERGNIMDRDMIEQRLNKLEKEVRIWRVVVLLLVVVFVGIGARQTDKEKITVREVTVSNGAGVQTRIQPDGILLYQDGKLKATVGSETDSAAIMLYDKTAKPGIIMHVTGGKPVIQLRDNTINKEKTITP
jgi:hypothetical protein